MIALHPEFIIDKNENRKAVVLPFEEWENLIADIEELDDIRAFDEAKSDKDDETIPFDQAVAELRTGNK
ncbi:MAG: hypothetical protein EOL87_18250 [Spartobacteria bacterium]|nr:hypothetical protein [Spartobacteria bacterium]